MSDDQISESYFDGCMQDESISSDPRKKQIGGTHYSMHAIQPIDYITKNGLNYCEGNVVKYVTRWKNKDGVQDLEKAKHYIDILIEMEKEKE